MSDLSDLCVQVRKMMIDDPGFLTAVARARRDLSNELGERTTRKLVGSKRAVRKAVRMAAKSRK